MEDAYPVFDRNSEDFNEDMTNEVVELRDAFIMKGYEASRCTLKSSEIRRKRSRS